MHIFLLFKYTCASGLIYVSLKFFFFRRQPSWLFLNCCASSNEKEATFLRQQVGRSGRLSAPRCANRRLPLTSHSLLQF